MTKDSHEIFKNFLKAENHRITPERFEVLDYALAQKGHFAADELYIAMKSDSSNISRATVYNTLELIAKCGLLAKRNFGDGRTNYETNFEKNNHDHLICTNCGEIIEFYSPEIQKIIDEVSERLGFEPADYSFNIFGRCKNKDNCDITKKNREQ
ncbi:MAG: transcriptional repressor [Ignavibacteria bacterium]|nr:MAG: transcriptional repressor [Ignavibacteria bacterium]